MLLGNFTTSKFVSEVAGNKSQLRFSDKTESFFFPVCQISFQFVETQKKVFSDSLTMSGFVCNALLAKVAVPRNQVAWVTLAVRTRLPITRCARNAEIFMTKEITARFVRGLKKVVVFLQKNSSTMMLNVLA